MEASGIQFAFDVETQKIISEGTRYRLVGKETELVADMIFCATGRQPNTESLALEQANVVFDKHGIEVNDYLQSKNFCVWRYCFKENTQIDTSRHF